MKFNFKQLSLKENVKVAAKENVNKSFPKPGNICKCCTGINRQISYQMVVMGEQNRYLSKLSEKFS